MDFSISLSPSLKFFVISFLSLLTLVNPIGLTPVYVSLIEHIPKIKRSRVLIRAIITATLVLIIFMLLGRLIFLFFGITIDAFRIVGGILFFKVGMDMMEAKLSRTKSTPLETEEALQKEEIAYTPIGIPLIAGPGSITSVMIFSSEATNYPDRLILLSAIFSVMIITFIVLHSAELFTRKFGTTGLRILQRIMGLILMVIAVQFIVNGLTPIVTNWLSTALHPPG